MNHAAELRPSARKVADALRANGVLGPIREFVASTKAAADATTALDCAVEAIASCLVIILNDEPIVILIGSTFRFDTQRFTTMLGASLMRQATPDEVFATTFLELLATTNATPADLLN